MSAAPAYLLDLAARLSARFGERLAPLAALPDELTFEVQSAELTGVCTVLRDEFQFEMLVDLSGIDYLHYGLEEWQTNSATSRGFGRATPAHAAVDTAPVAAGRFAVVYHLLSIEHNLRVRLRAYCEAGDVPMIDSVVDVWPGANWYEREVFDLFGVYFRGHPDLRRILTDYGFVGFPFRKDFPLSGHVEVRYDPDKGRVVYQPVSIEPRTLVPRVIRDDQRYDPLLTSAPAVVGKPDA